MVKLDWVKLGMNGEGKGAQLHFFVVVALKMGPRQ